MRPFKHKELAHIYAPVTLEGILQDSFGLKGNLFRSRPYKDADGTEHWFTKAGSEAYDRFIDFLCSINVLAEPYVGELVNTDAVNALIKIFDEFDTELPWN